MCPSRHVPLQFLCVENILDDKSLIHIKLKKIQESHGKYPFPSLHPPSHDDHAAWRGKKSGPYEWMGENASPSFSRPTETTYYFIHPSIHPSCQPRESKGCLVHDMPLTTTIASEVIIPFLPRTIEMRLPHFEYKPQKADKSTKLSLE